MQAEQTILGSKPLQLFGHFRAPWSVKLAELLFSARMERKEVNVLASSAEFPYTSNESDVARVHLNSVLIDVL